jgi:hypothetical protein
MIIIKITINLIHKVDNLIEKITGRGIISVNSISKIKKITAIKKNRTENGSRADLLGSNPHSKGEGFSRSNISFLKNRELTQIKRKGSMTVRKINNMIISS